MLYFLISKPSSVWGAETVPQGAGVEQMHRSEISFPPVPDILHQIWESKSD